ncbi:hypothetical protein BC831DRAFT_449223 [Entophlyctis helioformis]|nr:hypothetical protein BC831DRAFT_449223 [Entophlyctis helioformis]
MSDASVWVRASDSSASKRASKSTGPSVCIQRDLAHAARCDCCCCCCCCCCWRADWSDDAGCTPFDTERASRLADDDDDDDDECSERRAPWAWLMLDMRGWIWGCWGCWRSQVVGGSGWLAVGMAVRQWRATGLALLARGPGSKVGQCDGMRCDVKQGRTDRRTDGQSLHARYHGTASGSGGHVTTHVVH